MVWKAESPSPLQEMGTLRDLTISNRPPIPITNNEHAHSEDCAGDGDAQLQTQFAIGTREDPNEGLRQDIEIEVFSHDPILVIPESSNVGKGGSHGGGPTIRTIDRGLLWFLSTTGYR